MGAEFWIIGSILIVIGGFLSANHFVAWRESEVERSLLRERLQQLGLDSSKFSEACLDQLVVYATTSQDHLALPKSSYMPIAIDRVCKHVGQICNGDQNFKPNEISEQIAHGYLNPYWKILEKHHPDLFALDELHITQSFGKVLLPSESGRDESDPGGAAFKPAPLFGKQRNSESGIGRKSRGTKQRRRVQLG